MGNNKGGKVKVLQVTGGFRSDKDGNAVSGGVASFLYNYYTKMDRDKTHFDFMAIRNQVFEPYRSELEELGSELYTLDIQSDGFKRFFETIKKLSRFLKQNNYDAVHINIGSFFPVLTCAIASKIAGVKNIIAHSHSAGFNSKKKRFLIDLSTPLLTLFADKYCACSLLAAKNLFSKNIIKKEKFKIIKNAIDTDKFNYDEEVRDNVRSKLGYGDELVVGHVGRFVEVKNHDFLIDLFKNLNEEIPNARLLLLGDGELKPRMEEKVKELGLTNHVKFMGRQNDIHCYYQAMDLLIMPSIVEGFPIVAMEGQSVGLPTYVSSNVTEEAKITELCKFFDLIKGPDELCIRISKDIKNLKKRKDYSKEIINAGYDLNSNLNTFESLYF